MRTETAKHQAAVDAFDRKPRSKGRKSGEASPPRPHLHTDRATLAVMTAPEYLHNAIVVTGALADLGATRPIVQLPATITDEEAATDWRLRNAIRFQSIWSYDSGDETHDVDPRRFAPDIAEEMLQTVASRFDRPQADKADAMPGVPEPARQSAPTNGLAIDAEAIAQSFRSIADRFRALATKAPELHSVLICRRKNCRMRMVDYPAIPKEYVGHPRFPESMSFAQSYSVGAAFVPGAFPEAAFPLLPQCSCVSMGDPHDIARGFMVDFCYAWRGKLESPESIENALIHLRVWYDMAAEAGRIINQAWPLVGSTFVDDYLVLADLTHDSLWIALLHHLGAAGGPIPALHARRRNVSDIFMIPPTLSPKESLALLHKPMTAAEVAAGRECSFAFLPPPDKVMRWWSDLEPGCFAASALVAGHLARVLEQVAAPIMAIQAPAARNSSSMQVAAAAPTVVLWESAAHTDRNIRLARTRSAYLEAHGDVSAAMAALRQAGNPVARSTFYNHLDALDGAIPRWRESVQLSNPTGNLDGMRTVRTRKKSRDKVR